MRAYLHDNPALLEELKTKILESGAAAVAIVPETDGDVAE